MQSKINLTLYEVFGYLLPGILMLGAACIFGWGIYAPAWPFHFPNTELHTLGWAAIILASYFLGHAAQGISNVIFQNPEEWVLGSEGTAPEWIRQRAHILASKLVRARKAELGPKWIYRVLDECRVQSQLGGDSDVYLYREGFYRGLAIALPFLAVAAAVRFMRSAVTLQVADHVYSVSGWNALIGIAVIGALDWMCIRRYRRFAEYRVIRTVMVAILADRPQMSIASTTTPEHDALEIGGE